MKICDKCFSDEELKRAINSVAKEVGICDVCGETSNIIDIDFFADFINDVISLFTADSRGASIVSIIQKDWNLFANEPAANAILGYFINNSTCGFDITSKITYIPEITESLPVWDELKQKVMGESRFCTDIEEYLDSEWLNHNTEIKQGQLLYRARIVPSGRTYFNRKNMGCPPVYLTPAGRANPLGIPYLYLCQDEETTYYEVRALYLDKLAVGCFRVERDLKILDFTAKMSLYGASITSDYLPYQIIKYKTLQLISNDLSKPLTRYDTELEYVPTQFICEYCKMNGVDGIKFNSSLHRGGVNVVLFDSKSALCQKVKSRIIRNVNISR